MKPKWIGTSLTDVGVPSITFTETVLGKWVRSMKNLHRRLLVGSAVVLVMGVVAAPSVAEETYSWSGIYIGGGVSANISNYDTNIDYNDRTRYYSDDGGVYAGDNGVDVTRFGYIDESDIEGNFGWTDSGHFTGVVYDTIQSFKLTPSDDHGASGFLLDNSSVASRWISTIIDNEARAGANLYTGYQYHSSSGLVFGVEGQVSFANYDEFNGYQWSVSGTRSESAFDSDSDTAGDDETASATSTIDIDGMNYDESATVTTTCYDYCVVANQYDVDLLGSFEQNNILEVNLSVGPIIAPVARIGAAHGRFQLFGFAGPAVSRVKLQTNAAVTETGSMTVDSAGGSSNSDYLSSAFIGETDHDGTTDYSITTNWHGSTDKWLTGYRVGAGAEYAATDNLILRLTYDYTDLGSIETTAVADRSNTAGYTVSNDDLSSHGVTIGAALKF